MSVPCGSAAPFPILDRRVRAELMAHRAKVFAALSRHSDPALREIGRLLAAGAASPQQLRENPLRADQLRRIARKLKEVDPETRGPGTNPSGSATQPVAPDRSPHGSGAQPVPAAAPSIGPGAQPTPVGAPFSGPAVAPSIGPGAQPTPAVAPSTGPGAQVNRAGARYDRAGARFEGANSCGTTRSTGSSHDRTETGHAHEAGPAREPTTPTRTMVREVCPPSGGEPTRRAG